MQFLLYSLALKAYFIFQSLEESLTTGVTDNLLPMILLESLHASANRVVLE